MPLVVVIQLMVNVPLVFAICWEAETHSRQLYFRNLNVGCFARFERRLRDFLFCLVMAFATLGLFPVFALVLYLFNFIKQYCLCCTYCDIKVKTADLPSAIEEDAMLSEV